MQRTPVQKDRYRRRPFNVGTQSVWMLGCLVAVTLASGSIVARLPAVALSREPAVFGDGQGGRSQRADANRRQRFTHNGQVENEGTGQPDRGGPAPAEAPAAFDNLTNGFNEQGPPFESLDEDSIVPLRSFNDNRFIFEEVETIADGLGPTYNAQSCRECHQDVVTGGASQVAEHRTGRVENGQFFESLGGSLIHSRATHAEATEIVAFQDDIQTFRISTNTLGSGFVEAIANATILGIRDRQPQNMRGTAVVVPVLEANGVARIGRFGWKGQHASLESFAADAYLNEMGITTPLLPDENTSSGRDVAAYDLVPDPEDDGMDVVAFANFMRSTKAPPRGDITPDVIAGDEIFTRIGCATCHVPSITTAPAGTRINGGALVVTPALGSKIIHPYSDFLLHDIGTGDGMPVLPTEEYFPTANQIRTAPLWALRTRNRLMHDGLSFTREEAIGRHQGQASEVRRRFDALSAAMKAQLLRFLDSL
jgi:Di-haem oxidoreductase, putative peroxidase